jgi:predicted O-methyltransferase YrrM
LVLRSAPARRASRGRHAQCFAAIIVARPSALSSYLAVVGNPAVIRARMAAAAPMLAVRRDPRSRAIARALATAASGRLPREEREWAARIEARRRTLASREAPTSAGIEPGSEGMPPWAETLGGTYAIDGLSVMFSIPREWGRLLMRLVRELAPRSCVELGTAFGISAAYQAAALELNGSGRLITLDAAREWGAIAEEGFDELGLTDRVGFRVGQIADTLADVADEAAPVDFIFVDAEHQHEATLAYFESLLPRLSARAVLVLDDIGFPVEMRHAWRAIRNHERVATAVGLGRLGIVTIA